MVARYIVDERVLDPAPPALRRAAQSGVSRNVSRISGTNRRFCQSIASRNRSVPTVRARVASERPVSSA
jgi:hypothetical protein